MEILGLVFGVVGMTMGILGFVFAIKSITKTNRLEKRLNELDDLNQEVESS